ncbi:MAG TPA: hypothetical protein VEI97_04460 [bacterium]|nr:hypothetical protein [bacterium]
MRRSLLIVACCALTLPAAACAGAGGERLGEFLGDTGARMERGLSEEAFASLPAISTIDLSGPLTAADYRLWQDHMQAFGVTTIDNHCGMLDGTQLNVIINRYRWDVGEMVADLRSGEQSPEEVCRFLKTVRASAANDILKDALKPEFEADVQADWDRNEAFWTEIGYPGGAPDLLAEAVTTIGITGEQAAAIAEIWIKASIQFSRLVNPAGTVPAEGTDVFGAVESDEGKFEAVGMKAWNAMMEVFTPEQTRKAWGWYRKVERKFENYHAKHQVSESGVEHRMN